jgi:NAD-dependent deacetylase
VSDLEAALGVDDRTAAELDARLGGARRVTVLTGAGVSAASGVPTFRGPGGLWRTHRPEDLATPDAFARDPRLVWEWYDWRRQRLAACRPNAAHEVLARWGARWPALTLVTQNVDDLHERAGSAAVLHLHGSIWEVRCNAGCGRGRAPRRLDDVPLATLPPRCPHCGALDRPGVVWFGEALDAGGLQRATHAAAACDVFLAVGTSAQVHPAAGLIPHARRRGAFVVEINPDATPYSADVDVALAAPAEVALPWLDARPGGRPSSGQGLNGV